MTACKPVRSEKYIRHLPVCVHVEPKGAIEVDVGADIILADVYDIVPVLRSCKSSKLWIKVQDTYLAI